ncbi:MAG: type II secretion system GspH family protein [Patescibacteria group bacterium]|nr:type II secretion system GspH family protein [Patescibacteria group bacterium]
MKKSFSLIEILVFISILSVFFIAVLSVSVFFLRNFKTQQYKILATHLLEEAIEWIRFEKDFDWYYFSQKSSLSGKTYCLNELNWNNQFPCGENYSLGIPNIFKREVILRNLDSSATKIEVIINVFWFDLNSTNKVSSKFILAINQ